MHSLRSVEKCMRNVNEKKKFLMCGKCVLSTLYEVFGESSWSVYEYSKSLRINGKSMKWLKFFVHFFNTSTSFHSYFHQEDY